MLAPFSYTQLLSVSVLGFMIFGEVPDAYTVIGAGFIVARTLHAHRERSAARSSSLSRASRPPTPESAGYCCALTICSAAKMWRECHSVAVKRSVVPQIPGILTPHP